MKKNLLFVIPSLSVGGGEKSLVNLLSNIDYSLYNVDLVLFNKTGLFLNLLPDQVDVLELPDEYETFASRLWISIRYFLRNKQILLAYSRIMYFLINRFLSKNRDRAEQYTWKYRSSSLKSVEKVYDVAIGYLEKSSIYFVVDKVKSKKKIGWIHTNYSNSGMNPYFDFPYFEKLNYIITVSEECAKSLRECFFSFQKKIIVIENIVSPSTIKNLSKGKICEGDIKEENCITLLTIGRLSYEKGIDLAIKACRDLVNKGYKIIWYVLGNGTMESILKDMIKRNNLEDNFKLLGVRNNPYPYLRKVNIYVQPSRNEGKSMAIEEAKILNKPIVVTNFKTVTDQIMDGENGIIVGINERELSDGIEKLIKDKELRNHIINNLSKEKLDTEDEIHKLYKIFGDDNEENFVCNE